MVSDYIFGEDVSTLTDEQRYIYARFRYRIGSPVISDIEYDSLDKKFKSLGKLTEYTERSYDQDPVPYAIFEILEKTPEEISTMVSVLNWSGAEVPEDVKPVLLEVECKSIHSENTLEMCYPWMAEHKGVPCLLMAKVDGNNTTSIWTKPNPESDLSVYRYTQTRGSGDSKPINITANMSKIVPKALNIKQDHLIVTAEAVYDERYMDFMRESVGVSLLTPRTAALSFLRIKDYPEELYKYIRLLVFKTNYGDKLSDSLTYAASLGFEIVPTFKFVPDFEDFEDFRVRMTDTIWKFYKLCHAKGIDIDGLVAQVDSKTEFSQQSTSGLYDFGNFAVKAVAWEPDIFESVVVRIEMEPGVEQYNCVALVEPVTTKNGKKLSRVNLYNPQNMMANGVTAGSRIRFKYYNETTIEFIAKI